MKPFNKDLIPRIELAPNDYNLAGRGNPAKDFVLIGTYGALFKASNFIERLAPSFKEIGMDVPNEDLFSSHFVGWYKFPFVKLSFQKKAWLADSLEFSTVEGKATLRQGDETDVCYIGVFAIPKIALRFGSPLMLKEGCNNSDFSGEGNHYMLLSNWHPLHAVQNDVRETPSIFPQLGESAGIPNVIPEGGIMFFNVTSWSLNKDIHNPLKPSEEYWASINAAHKRAVKDGFQLPKSYLERIQAIDYIGKPPPAEAKP
jgi:hypothetical protein